MPAKNSKTVPPKAFDVIAPGRAAPSPSARPIIVTNRPMIKDPMAPSDASVAKSAEPIKPKPVQAAEASHVGKTIAAIGPETTADNAAAAVKGDIGAAAADAPTAGVTQPGADAISADPENTTAPAQPAEQTEPENSTPAADSIADNDADKKDSAIDRPQPGDVAAAEKASAAEKAAAAEHAAQEKIIASRQYYLPIDGSAKHRGLQWPLLVLLLVILLGLAWLDIAMDAGIIHIHGIQPLTHFFRH